METQQAPATQEQTQKTKAPRKAPEPVHYYAVVAVETGFVPCDDTKKAAANDIEHDLLDSLVEELILTANTKAQLKEMLSEPRIIRIIGIFRGRLVKFAEKRSVSLC